jgi:hypothetical protein
VALEQPTELESAQLELPCEFGCPQALREVLAQRLSDALHYIGVRRLLGKAIR